jgi:cytidylate kinase
VSDSPAEYALLLRERKDSNVRRYRDLYQVNPYLPELYDLVIDTDNYSLEEVVEMILGAYDDWLMND